MNIDIRTPNRNKHISSSGEMTDAASSHGRVGKPRSLIYRSTFQQYSLFVLIAVVGMFLFASQANAASITGSNTSNISIPDGAPGNWVSSTIAISGTPSGAVVTGIDIYFKCIHPYSGDLVVDLNADATGALGDQNLWNREGGSADNPTRTTTSIHTFDGLSVNRTWYLYARDYATGDSGYIDEWTITIYYTAPATPTISSISPTSMTADGVGHILTINGSNFASGNYVQWHGNSTSWATTNNSPSLSSSSKLTVSINPGTVNDTLYFRVCNSSGSCSGSSGALTVTTLVATPTISSISPTSMTADGVGHTLTINGSNFASGNYVQWHGNSTSWATTNNSPSLNGTSQLTVSINPGTVNDALYFRVCNSSGSCSGSSGALTVTALVATPTISSISPTSMTADGVGHTLNINGSNFASGNYVQWHGNSTSWATTNNSPSLNGTSQLTVSINPGTVNDALYFRVCNSSGSCSGSSGALTVTALVATPTISSISPTSMTADGVGHTLTINGSNFQAGNIVQFKWGVPPGDGVWTTGNTPSLNGTSQMTVSMNPGTDNDTIYVRVCRSSSATTPADCSSGTQSITVIPQSTGFYLSFPLGNKTPYDAEITSVFDHSVPDGRYTADNKVAAFSGEVGDQLNEMEGCVTFGASILCSYEKADGSNFLIGKANYVGTLKTGSSTLNYDGHPGYDYRVETGTPVYAAADGIVVFTNTDPSDPSGVYVRLQHDSAGYQTQYLHLSEVLVSENQSVTREQLIGESGNTGASEGPHLHFEVKKHVASGDWIAVDPYGWQGSEADPYLIQNINLWQVPPSDAPVPTISELDPTTLPSSNTTQAFKVIGNNFVTGSIRSHLVFTDPTETAYSSSAHPDREGPISGTEFNYQLNNGNTPGIWSVKVVNPDGKQSNSLTFEVTSSVPPVGTTVLGVDVSHWQGTINWPQVYGAGRRFAFVKATEGNLAEDDDPMFLQNMSNGKSAGLLVGAYHVATSPLASAADEANHFLAVAGSYITAGNLRPVLDIEPEASNELGSGISQWIRDWCDTVETTTGARPILYMIRYDATHYMASDLTKYPIWVATDSNDPGADPGDLGPWTSWTFQQYGSDHIFSTVPGISGYADLDSFNGDLATLSSIYVITTAVCPDCSGDAPVVIQNLRFPPGTDCECNATSPVTIGPNVTFESGAKFRVKAPKVSFKTGVNVKDGADFKSGQ